MKSWAAVLHQACVKSCTILTTTPGRFSFLWVLSWMSGLRETLPTKPE
jgi:hypothetical protein